MSKVDKQKISVELPKPRQLLKNRLSVFQRLGLKKPKGQQPQLPNVESDNKSPTVVQIADPQPTPQPTKPSTNPTANINQYPGHLEDVDRVDLEKKREQLQKELAIQIRMDTSRKLAKDVVMRKRKRPQTSSSSSSSSSGSGSSSDSSTSSSGSNDSRYKGRKPVGKKQRRGSSSSSDDRTKKMMKTKRVCQKKLIGDPNKLAHARKVQGGAPKLRKRSPHSPTCRRKMAAVHHKMNTSSGKTAAPLSVENVSKHQRAREAMAREKERIEREKEREREFQLREKERERERLRLKVREQRPRSRSPPKIRSGKSRSPTRRTSDSRDMKGHLSPRNTSPRPRSGLGNRHDRSVDRISGRMSASELHKRHGNSRERERERRDIERKEREAARDKERKEALARCQERQRERERIAREQQLQQQQQLLQQRNRRLDRERDDRGLILPRERSRERSIDRDRRAKEMVHPIRDRMEREVYDRALEMRNYDRHRYEKDERMMVRERESDRGTPREYAAAVRHREEENRHGSPFGVVREKYGDEMHRERPDVYHPVDKRFENHPLHMRDEHRHDYPGPKVYADEKIRLGRDREWLIEQEIRENERAAEHRAGIVERGMPNRHHVMRGGIRNDWQRGPKDHPAHHHHPNDNFNLDGALMGNKGLPDAAWQQRNDRKWDGNWPMENEGLWDEANDPGWQQQPEHSIAPFVPDKIIDTPPNRRFFPGWRGRGRGNPFFGDFRRHLPHQHQPDNPLHEFHHRFHPNAQNPMLPHEPNIVFGHHRGNMHPNTNLYRINRLTHPHLNPPKPADPATVANVTQAQPGVPDNQTPVVVEITKPITNIIEPTIDNAAKPDIITETVTNDQNVQQQQLKPDSTDEANSAEVDQQQLDDESNQEQIADNLSEISDDADDILNRQEEQKILLVSAQSLLGVKEAATDKNLGTIPLSSLTDPQLTNPNILLPDDPLSVPAIVKDLAEEIDLDFEEISDGEMEEEARIKGLGDALGVDWSSLVLESKAIAREQCRVPDTTTKQRWQPHRILLDIGVSFKMVGGEMVARKILTDAENKLREEEELKSKLKLKQEDVNVKTEIVVKEEQIDVPMEANIKEEDVKKELKTTVDECETETESFLLHPTANAQVGNRVANERRKTLVVSAPGLYSRALSARRDLQMRRKLCRLPISGRKLSTATNITDAVNLVVDKPPCTSYASIAAKLFQRAIAEVK